MTTQSLPAAARAVLDFWVSAGPEKWFAKDPAFDAQFKSQFLTAHMQAAARELDSWAESADGCLALLILLDQFPRNAFRGTAHMFATDSLALYFARHAQTQGFQLQLEPALQTFMVLPFEHSENLQDQHTAVALCQHLAPKILEFAHVHLDVIRRFGRFPHRNAVLGRETTPAEQAFLDQGGFGG